jgi:prevent-host-death family protein
MTIEVSITDLNRGISEYVNRAAYGKQPVVITSHGKRKAALIGIDDLEQLQKCKVNWGEFVEANGMIGTAGS